MKPLKLDPAEEYANLQKSGVYTLYKSNRLEQSLAVINMDNTVVQLLFDELADPVVLKRRTFDGDNWSDWINVPLK